MIELVQNAYRLESPTDVVPHGHRGYLVTSGQHMYWLRRIEFSYQVKYLYYDMSFTSYLKSRGLPVRTILRTSDDNVLVDLDGAKYYLMEFYSGAFQPTTSTKLTLVQIEEAARKLAQLHIYSRQYEGPKQHSLPFASQKSYKILREVQAAIHKRGSSDQFDNLAIQAIERKLAFITRNPFEQQDFVHRCRLMNHGDYHPGNVVFDERNTIVAIIDFEHCKDVSRLWDVSWALTWFARLAPTEAFTGKMDTGILDTFLSSYNSVFRLDREDINALTKMCCSACFHSTYFLEHVYLRTRVVSDIVACRSLEEWFWWPDNLNEISDMFLETISKSSG